MSKSMTFHGAHICNSDCFQIPYLNDICFHYGLGVYYHDALPASLDYPHFLTLFPLIGATVDVGILHRAVRHLHANTNTESNMLPANLCCEVADTFDNFTKYKMEPFKS